MKKLLFASTALIASAGIAAAEVSVSGDGRMGVVYDSMGLEMPGGALQFAGTGQLIDGPPPATGTSGGNPNWGFTNRIRISFSASGETDTGLTFGGSIRADNAGPGAGGTAGNVYVDGAFGKLSMGDVGGGDDAVLGGLHGVGLTGLGSNSLNFASSGDLGPSSVLGTGETAANGRVLYEYDMDGFSFAASHSQTGNTRSIGIGAGYSMAGFDVAVGFGHARFSAPGLVNTRTRDISASAGYSFGDFEVSAVAQQKQTTAGGVQTDRTRSLGLSGAANFDMVEVTAFAMQMRSTAFNQSGHSFGIGAAYDLGGGASLEGGIARTRGFSVPGVAQPTRTSADFGVSLSF